MDKYHEVIQELSLRGITVNFPSPIHEVKSDIVSGASRAKIWIKRDDLISLLFPGNKFRKLVPHIQKIQRENHTRVLTFGGAFSNHLYAFSSMVKVFEIEGIAVVRGERREPLNPVVSYAEACGVELRFIDRISYLRRHEDEFHNELRNKFGDFYLIPEGGTDRSAVDAVSVIAREITEDFDEVYVAVGTGGTLAGLAIGFEGKARVTGVSSLKGAHSLDREVSELTGGLKNWRIDHAHHFGGYAKTTPGLLAFQKDIEAETGIKFDRIYTAKALYAMSEAIRENKSTPKKYLFIHTGGVPV